MRGLREAGLPSHAPEGSYFILADISHLGFAAVFWCAAASALLGGLAAWRSQRNEAA